MKKSIILLAMMAASGSVLALGPKVHYADLNVREVVKTDDVGVTAVDEFKVDGITIELTREDKVKAKNWNLSRSDWAKYKYIMEYTPRGAWSPDLDPPIALGIEAETRAEQEKYAKLANQLEWERRQKELGFQSVGIDMLVHISPGLFDKEVDEGLSQWLPDKRKVLRSVFISRVDCDFKCQDFLFSTVANKGADTHVVIYTDQSHDYVYSLYARSGWKYSALQEKGVEIKVDPEKMAEISKTVNQSPPFYVQQKSLDSSENIIRVMRR
ncbi:hypothetical protein [Vibrio barjaei]|uniref:hypothetical protein n=1 Tax=Vibrio barjaei TaxID=1676683 RepID=UPI002284C926|nr:hypothetical protein [Vibrio barjaei]MCY9872972.1 hypothetical protein [Vibrio barjaei]